MNTSCTMLIGHIEFVRDRIEHMSALARYAGLRRRFGRRNPNANCENRTRPTRRTLIRQPENRWPGVFAKSQPTPTPIANRPIHRLHPLALPARKHPARVAPRNGIPTIHGPFDDSTNEDILRGRVVRMAGADEYLRMLAIARLFFDNIPSLQSSWVTMGPKIGQLALFFGANDMGSVMMEENVVSAAGTTYKLSEREICRLIRDSRLDPRPARSVLQRPPPPRRARFPRPAPAGRIRRCGTCAKIDKEFIGAQFRAQCNATAVRSPDSGGSRARCFGSALAYFTCKSWPVCAREWVRW
jgi:cyclic dehypoxanthinyl futalosine synthase